MRVGLAFLLGLFCLGCHRFLEPGPNGPTLGTIPANRKGREETREPRIPDPSPPLPDELPSDPKSHLIQAANLLEQGRLEDASHHLDLFVQGNPGHRKGRFYLAELLTRLDRGEEARGHYEQFITDLQEELVLDLRHLIHCHGRLAEIGEKEGDEFSRHLHRGIALYWLAQAPASNPEEEDLLPPEALLCKAAAALNQAHQLSPDHPRPCCYLHQVWRKLGQDRPAQRFRDRALAQGAFCPLTPAEQRGLSLSHVIK